MSYINLDRLDPHPDNANIMSKEMFDKLIEHLRSSQHYPPLIVRPHPTGVNRYEILDGHHRAKALAELGHSSANCEVWEVDDEQAKLFLLTLNRLRGEDDPYARGKLLADLKETLDLDELARQLPDTRTRLETLLQTVEPPENPVATEQLQHLPQAITFFLTREQHRRLIERLRAVHSNRSAALAGLLELDHDA